MLSTSTLKQGPIPRSLRCAVGATLSNREHGARLGRIPQPWVLKETNMKFIVFGQIGSDAGYWYLGPDGKWHHGGGWGVDSFIEVNRALTILGEAARFKTPGLADSVSKRLTEFVQKELGAHLGDHLKDGGVVIINASR